MYKIDYTHKFKKDLKLCAKRGYNMSLFHKVATLLEKTGTLPPEYKPHKLSGNYEGLWECHIQSDWLMMWQQNETELLLVFTGTGTHSDLF